MVQLLELKDLEYDGLAALEALISKSPYGSLLQAVASLTLFTHPETVRILGPRNIFPTIRNAARRGEFIDTPTGKVMLDDNKSPTDAFMWANGWKRRPRDLQFNHIYQASSEVEHYTNLRNICVSPSFLAKLTDTHLEVRAALKYRVFQLYEYKINSSLPKNFGWYERLKWATPLPFRASACQDILAEVEKRKKDRTCVASRRLGLGLDYPF